MSCCNGKCCSNATATAPGSASVASATRSIIWKLFSLVQEASHLQQFHGNYRQNEGEREIMENDNNVLAYPSISVYLSIKMYIYIYLTSVLCSPLLSKRSESALPHLHLSNLSLLSPSPLTYSRIITEAVWRSCYCCWNWTSGSFPSATAPAGVVVSVTRTYIKKLVQFQYENDHIYNLLSWISYNSNVAMGTIPVGVQKWI